STQAKEAPVTINAARRLRVVGVRIRFAGRPEACATSRGQNADNGTVYALLFLLAGHLHLRPWQRRRKLICPALFHSGGTATRRVTSDRLFFVSRRSSA